MCVCVCVCVCVRGLGKQQREDLLMLTHGVSQDRVAEGRANRPRKALCLWCLGGLLFGTCVSVVVVIVCASNGVAQCWALMLFSVLFQLL